MIANINKRIKASLAVIAICAVVINGNVLFVPHMKHQKQLETYEIKSKCSNNPIEPVIKFFCLKIPSLATANDHDASSTLRNFVHEEIIRFANAKIFQESSSLEFTKEYEAVEYIELFETNQKGALCGATADFLKNIYKAFGLNAYTYNFGVVPGSHVVTIVEIGNDLYLQDAFFNYTLSRREHGFNPIPINEVIDKFNPETGEIEVFLSEDVKEPRSHTMQQMFVELIERDCPDQQIVAQGIRVCRIQSRRLSNLDTDERFYRPLEEMSEQLALSSNPAKFLYALSKPIGNDAQIVCVVTGQECDAIALRNLINKFKNLPHKVKWKLRTLINEIKEFLQSAV